jgi:PAS domain S-box-containing protein
MSDESRVIEERDAQFRLLAERSRDVIGLHDPDGRIRYVNPAARTLLGYSADALLGTYPFALVHPDDLARVRDDAIARRAADVGKAEPITFRCRTRDGTYIWLEVLTDSVRDAHGEDLCLVTYSRDVSARLAAAEALEESEQRYRSFFERSPDGVIVHVDGRILLANASAALILGTADAAALRDEPLERYVHPADRQTFLSRTSDISDGVVERRRYRIRRADGSIRYVEALRDDVMVLGRPAVQCVIRDISSHVHAELALADMEHRYQSILEILSEGVTLQDARGAIVFWNPSAEAILGINGAELAGRSSVDSRWRAVHPDGSDWPGETHPSMVSLRTGLPVSNVVMGIHTPDGRLRWLTVNSRPLFADDTRGATGGVTTFRDSTESRQALVALRDSEERYRLALEYAVIGNAIVGLDGRCVNANRALCQIVGYTEAELVGHDYRRLADLDRLPAGVFDGGREHSGEVESVEQRYVHRSGRTVWATMSVSCARDETGAPRGFLVQLQDITDRKRLEDELTHEREFLVGLLDNLSEGVLAGDAAGNPTRANRSHELLYGIDGWPATPELREVFRLRMRDFDDQSRSLLHSEMPLVRAAAGEHVDQQLIALMPTGTPVGVIAADGVRLLAANCRPILDTRGTMIGTVMSHRDVTREYADHASLLASEERFRLLSEASMDGVFVSRQSVILETNAAFGRMIGSAPSALLGRRVADLIVPVDDGPTVDGRPRIPEAGTLVQGLRADGTRFDGQVITRSIMYHGAPAQISVLRDVSEWTALSRLKSEFVSTVSHELRTPLTSIHGALRLLGSGRVGVLPEAAAPLVSIAIANSDRLVRLVTDLLDLDRMAAGRLALRRTPLTADDVIGAAVDGIRAMADGHHQHLDAQVAVGREFSGDRDRVVQVLTNLLSNAIKFSPPYGTIMVRAAPASGAQSVRFAVTNSGAGIPPADIGRLFERFQQLDGSDARRVGGSGLGLAISKAIVEEHGGRIGVDSVPGSTTFWFELPVEPDGLPPAIA